jgi:RNA polymerase sigma-70 factor (ECF subfamily)
VQADAVAAALAQAHRSEWAFVLSATVRVAGDLDVAEECAQEAYVSALQAWTRDGVPERPGAWLTTAARNKALDRLRREVTLRRKLPLLVEPATVDPHDPADLDWPDAAVPDDRLRLVFTCCHPTLAPEARVALTLRLVCGVPTPDVARAFLVSEPTMAARITRAKKKISEARIPYRVPGRAELPERLDSVLTAVHLLFSTGHTAGEGDALVREELCDRALHLARTLAALLPEQAETRGLLGLLLLTDARRATRTDEQGRLLLLADQDRTRWDQRAILEGLTVTAGALASGPPGRFTLQAAIAGVHAMAPSLEQTDWPRVVHLYDRLLAVWNTPVVALNRAAAVAFADGRPPPCRSSTSWRPIPGSPTTPTCRHPRRPAAPPRRRRRRGSVVPAGDQDRSAAAPRPGAGRARCGHVPSCARHRYRKRRVPAAGSPPCPSVTWSQKRRPRPVTGVCFRPDVLSEMPADLRNTDMSFASGDQRLRVYRVQATDNESDMRYARARRRVPGRSCWALGWLSSTVRNQVQVPWPRRVRRRAGHAADRTAEERP